MKNTYYVASFTFPFKIDTYNINFRPFGGRNHYIHADLDRLEMLIEYYENILINTKKTERPKIRKKITKINKKIILLKNENTEYFV